MQSLGYVVLRHTDTGGAHFDLMFETLPGSMLATWRSDSWPIEACTELKRLRDHRRLYLEYEGEIGGQRGMVLRIAEGRCEVEVGQDAVWTIRLLSGAPPQRLVFRQISGDRWDAEPAL
jgi:hypothetical protein